MQGCVSGRNPHNDILLMQNMHIFGCKLQFPLSTGMLCCELGFSLFFRSRFFPWHNVLAGNFFARSSMIYIIVNFQPRIGFAVLKDMEPSELPVKSGYTKHPS